ncbi:MAG: MucB/RseB C-terminal domain-containing protein [Burkholderiaceae bacterium]|nr:MucB/RseB C-terminal domain-containing protein [Burkholderiaceae bacterium]
MTAPPARAGEPERGTAEWLMRLQQAGRSPRYAGTVVISSSTGALSSARIVRLSEGDKRIERVETLTGAPRITYRYNGTVTSFWPQSGIKRIEQHEPHSVFPNMLLPGLDTLASAFYSAAPHGHDRVAGYNADVVIFKPKDDLRYGYRIWSDQKTGMALKMQTMAADGRVLEQVAFSELTFNTPVSFAALLRAMEQSAGYRVMRSNRVESAAQAEGWTLSAPVPGFRSQSCYRYSGEAGDGVHWVFSDGLASVSLFMQPYDANVHVSEGEAASGATHTLTFRLSDPQEEWWLTAVGEVPAQTLRLFAQRIQRIQ